MQLKIISSYGEVVSRMRYLQVNKQKFCNDKEFAPVQVEFNKGQPVLRLSFGRSIQYFYLVENDRFLAIKSRVSGSSIATYTTVFLVDCCLLWAGGLRSIPLVSLIIGLQALLSIATHVNGQRCAERFVRKYLADQVEVDD